MATAPGIDLDASDTLAGSGGWSGAGGRWRSTTCCWSGTGATCSPPTRATTPARTPTIPLPPGSDRLVQLGGEGTPRVRELTLCELGIAREVHVLAARAVAADVLDLRHRLPRVWAVFLTGRADAWLVRKIATLSRDLSLPPRWRWSTPRPRRAIAGQAPGPGAVHRGGQDHRGRPRRPRGQGGGRQAPPVRVAVPHRRDRAAARHRPVTAGDAAYVDAACWPGSPTSSPPPGARGRPAGPAPLDRVRVAGPARRAPRPAPRAHPAPRPRPTTPTPTRRAGRAAEPEPSRARARSGHESETGGARRWRWLPRRPPRRAPGDQPRPAPPVAVLYVHLHEAALTGTPGRGPGRGHRPARPDPAGRAARPHPGGGQAGDRPGRPGQRELLRAPRPGSRNGSTSGSPATSSRTPPASPAASTTTTRSPTGPRAHPGRPYRHNGQPLGRTGHRAKTHLGYRVIPLPCGSTLWCSPHGLHRVVDEHGTHPIDQDEADALTGPNPIHQAIVRLTIRHRAGLL